MSRLTEVRRSISLVRIQSGYNGESELSVMMASCFQTVGAMPWLLQSPVSWTSFHTKMDFSSECEPRSILPFKFFFQKILSQEQESNQGRSQNRIPQYF